MLARAKQRATCDVCGKEVSLMGLGTHRRAAHGITKQPGPGRWPTAAPAPAPTPAASAPAPTTAPWTPDRAREYLTAVADG